MFTNNCTVFTFCANWCRSVSGTPFNVSWVLTVSWRAENTPRTAGQARWADANEQQQYWCFWKIHRTIFINRKLLFTLKGSIWRRALLKKCFISSEFRVRGGRKDVDMRTWNPKYTPKATQLWKKEFFYYLMFWFLKYGLHIKIVCFSKRKWKISVI